MRTIRWAAILLGACTACNNATTAPGTMDELETPTGVAETRFVDNSNDVSGSGLRKGQPGALNGMGDFCTNGGCVATEGDCDSSSECTGGSVCLTDNGGRYAALTGALANQQDDHCAPSTCNNRVPDGTEIGVDCGNAECGACNPTCELANGHNDRCSYHCQCGTGVGDCDANDQCVGGLEGTAVCKADVGFRFNLAATQDVCVPSHCNDRQLSGNETAIDCGGDCGACDCPEQSQVPGGECTISCPCGINGGDCDSNADCEPGLVCVESGATDRCQPAGGPAPTCTAPGVQVSVAPSALAMVCDDPNNSTCEQDMAVLCPTGWRLCSRPQVNNRNTDWNYVTTQVTVGEIYCRLGGGAGHHTYGTGTNMSVDGPRTLCQYGSSRAACPAWYGCNEQQVHAVCCAPTPTCGNGVVDSVEEECDDANLNESDDCLNNCSWRAPAAHGVPQVYCN